MTLLVILWGAFTQMYIPAFSAAGSWPLLITETKEGGGRDKQIHILAFLRLNLIYKSKNQKKKRTDVFLTVKPLPLPIRLVSCHCISVQLTVVFFKQRDQYLNQKTNTHLTKTLQFFSQHNVFLRFVIYLSLFVILKEAQLMNACRFFKWSSSHLRVVG